MSLGPVIRNVVEDQRRAERSVKPDLFDRLHEVGELTDQGLLMRGSDGKLLFQPNYAGNNPAPKYVPHKEPAYIPFQGEHAHLNPEPAKPVAKHPTPEEIHALVNPTTDQSRYDPPQGRYALGQRVRKIAGMHKGHEGVIDNLRDRAGDREMHVLWDMPAPCGDNGWWSTSEKNAFKWEILGPVEAKTTSKIDPMKEPLKVGDRVLQTKADTVNYDVEAVVDRIESDGTLVLKWDRNPHGDNGRWGNTLRDCFRIVERDGVPIC